MLDIIKVLLPAILGVIGGILSVWFTSRAQIREIKAKNDLERVKERAVSLHTAKLQYIAPLHDAAQILHDRIEDLKKRRADNDRIMRDLASQFLQNKSEAPECPDGKYFWRDERDYIQWANTYGLIVLSSIMITALYLYYSSKVLHDLLRIELSPTEQSSLIEHLRRVRAALNGPYGIWIELHDSIGNYMIRKDGEIMNYRDFCYEMYDSKNWLWFWKIIDFYKDFDLKSNEEIQYMIDSLKELRIFLSQIMFATEAEQA